MAKYKAHTRDQRLMVPVILEEQIHPGTMEHAIDYLIDNKIDLSIFDKRYKNDDVGRPAWDPAVMLKIVLFAYSRGIVSSRKIARACRENITFMALADDSRPHFTSIADFISSIDEQILEIFQKVLFICSEMDLIGGEMFAVDGCKLSSNASKEWSGTHAQLKHKKKKLKKKIKNLVKMNREQDKDDDDHTSAKRNDAIDKLKKDVDKIDDFLQDHEPRQGQRDREIQSNITDPESAKMPTSHGVVQGYNGLAMVDSKHQIIVHAEAFGQGQEFRLLEPMYDGSRKNMTAIGKSEDYFKGSKILGDTNFHSNSNCQLMQEKGIDAYLPDGAFRKRDPRFANQKAYRPQKKKTKFTHEDFIYDPKRNRYTCPSGKEMGVERHHATYGNYIGRQYSCLERHCSVCKLREPCLSKKDTKRKYLFIIDRRINRNYSQEMKDKIDTWESREIYSHRMGIVEPVFGNIRTAKKLDRFTLRGKVKVTIQWMLYSIIHNIEKIGNYGLAYGYS